MVRSTMHSLTKKQKYVIEKMRSGYELARLDYLDEIKLFKDFGSEKVDNRIFESLLSKKLIKKDKLKGKNYSKFILCQSI